MAVIIWWVFSSFHFSFSEDFKPFIKWEKSQEGEAMAQSRGGRWVPSSLWWYLTDFFKISPGSSDLKMPFSLGRATQ